MISLQPLVMWLSVAVQGAAAALWFYATVAKVGAAELAAAYQQVHGAGSGPAQIVDDDDGSDIVATLKLQTTYNRWAAFATGLGVLLMAIGTALPRDG